MVTTSLPRIGQFVMDDLWPSDDHSLVGLAASSLSIVLAVVGVVC